MPQHETVVTGAQALAAEAGGPSRMALAWPHALFPFLALVATIIALYRETAVSMVTIWYRSETFTHGFVVLPIVLWLVWRSRAALKVLPPRTGLYYLVVLSGLAVMWLLGDLVVVNSVTQLAFVAMLVVSVPIVLGSPVATAIMFPLAFMFFAVPIGEFIMPQLMDWTADFTILALRLSGIPVFREGLNFVIPSGNWSVVEACSGVRYLIASLTVGTLYAYLNYQSTRRRLLFVLVAILVPIVANWLRAYIIVMLGHLSGNTIAVGVDHLIYGWVFFGLVILLMFMIGARWAEPEAGAALQARDVSVSINTASPPASRFWVAASLAAVIVAAPWLAKQAMEPAEGLRAPQLAMADTALQPWTRGDASMLGFKPSFDNPSAELNAVYLHDGQSVGVYIGYYRNQNYERKLVTSTNVLVPSTSKSWSQVEQGTASVDFGGTTRTVRFAELRRLGGAPATAPERLLVWQIYWNHGLLTSNDYLAKAYSAAYQLLGKGDDAAVLVLYAPIQGDGSGRQALAGFASAQYGHINAKLKAAATRDRD